MDATSTVLETQQSNISREEDDLSNDARKTSDATNVDENQLQADQEYIEKVLEDLQDCAEDDEEDTEYVFHTSLPEGKIYRQPGDLDNRSDGKSDRTGSSFSGYLKKQDAATDCSVQVEMEDRGEEMSSRATSHRYDSCSLIFLLFIHRKKE